MKGVGYLNKQFYECYLLIGGPDSEASRGPITESDAPPARLPPPLLFAYVLCILRGAKISYSFEYIQKFRIVVSFFFQ